MMQKYPPHYPPSNCLMKACMSAVCLSMGPVLRNQFSSLLLVRYWLLLCNTMSCSFSKTFFAYIYFTRLQKSFINLLYCYYNIIMMYRVMYYSTMGKYSAQGCMAVLAPERIIYCTYMCCILPQIYSLILLLLILFCPILQIRFKFGIALEQWCYSGISLLRTS